MAGSSVCVLLFPFRLVRFSVCLSVPLFCLVVLLFLLLLSVSCNTSQRASPFLARRAMVLFCRVFFCTCQRDMSLFTMMFIMTRIIVGGRVGLHPCRSVLGVSVLGVCVGVLARGSGRSKPSVYASHGTSAMSMREKQAVVECVIPASMISKMFVELLFLHRSWSSLTGQVSQMVGRWWQVGWVGPPPHFMAHTNATCRLKRHLSVFYFCFSHFCWP